MSTSTCNTMYSNLPFSGMLDNTVFVVVVVFRKLFFVFFLFCCQECSTNYQLSLEFKISDMFLSALSSCITVNKEFSKKK